MTDRRHWHEFGGEKYFVDRPYKELCYETITKEKDGNLHLMVWKYKPDTLNCFKCERDDMMVYFIMNQNNETQVNCVVARCLRCNITFHVPAFDPETHKNLAKKISDKIITGAEADVICKRLGITPPITEESINEEAKPIKDDISLEDITNGTFS